MSCNGTFTSGTRGATQGLNEPIMEVCRTSSESLQVIDDQGLLAANSLQAVTMRVKSLTLIVWVP